MRVQTLLFRGFLGGLVGSPLSAIALNVLASSVLAPSALAQVPNADLACYLNSPDGVQFDLSALCGSFTDPEAVVLQTGDVQVTLRWDTADDLDLYVRDPVGDEVFFGNRSIPSGGQLDVDANAGCTARMESPVENIFWPTGEGSPGDYVVTVDLFSSCGAEAPVTFTLTTLVRGETQTQTGTVSPGQSSVSFPFSFPIAGTDLAGNNLTEATLPIDETTRLPAVP